MSRASGRYICLDCGKKFAHERKAANHKHNGRVCVECGTDYTDRCAVDGHEYVGKECWLKRPSLHCTWDDPILILAELKYWYYHRRDISLHCPELEGCELCGSDRWIAADQEEMEKGDILFETAVCTSCGNQTPYSPDGSEG